MPTVIRDFHNQTKNIEFTHGLGDCCNFALMLSLWKKRGHDIRVACRVGEEREPLFRAAGVRQAVGQTTHHPFRHPRETGKLTELDLWSGNKIGSNLTKTPLPRIGEAAHLWAELLSVRLSLEPELTPGQRDRVDGFIAKIGAPFVLVHTRGHSVPHAKNFTPELEASTFKELRQFGSVLVLGKGVSHGGIDYLSEFGQLRLTELWYLISRALVLVGVDSGPYHFCRWTSTPCVGVWFDHHPARFALPREATANLVDGRHAVLNELRREVFNLCEVAQITSGAIASVVGGLL